MVLLLLVPETLVVLLLEASVVLTIMIPKINPPRADLSAVLDHHNNLSISLLAVLLVLIFHINITSMCNPTNSYLS